MELCFWGGLSGLCKEFHMLNQSGLLMNEVLFLGDSGFCPMIGSPA